MAKTNENGEMCLGKGENGMFTRAWSITDAMPNLTVDERAAVDAFGVRWFDGYSMYADSPVYLNALPVMQKYAGGDLMRKVKGRYGLADHTRPWTTPEHNPDYRDSKPWPKYFTAEMKELGLNYRPYRAWHRCKVRDEVRKTFSIEKYTMLKLRDENILLKKKIAEVDELKNRIAGLEATAAENESNMASILDLVEEMWSTIDELGLKQDRPRFYARQRVLDAVRRMN
jgi:hypothetical protein